MACEERGMLEESVGERRSVTCAKILLLTDWPKKKLMFFFVLKHFANIESC